MIDQATLENDLGLNQMTPEQRHAVLCDKMPILLSASAGSGKTFVLSTRVVYRLADPNCPISPERLLVVTFTKAAAREMRGRIVSVFHKLLEKHPNDRHLLRQQALLSQASITTIDSFCSNFLREQFERAGLSPSFRVCEQLQSQQILSDSMDELFEQEFQSDATGFQQLCDYFSLSSIQGLKSVLENLYHTCRTHPFPEQFLNHLPDLYRSPPEINKSSWAKEIVQFIGDQMSQALSMYQAALKLCEQDTALLQSWKPSFMHTMESLQNARNLAGQSHYTELPGVVRSIQPLNLPRYNAKTNSFDRELAEHVKKLYCQPAKKILSSLDEYLLTEQQYLHDLRCQLPILQQLIKLTKQLSASVANKKQEQNVIDFSDLLLMTLSILLKPTGQSLERTKLGEEMAARFDEILVDEFQDINQAQDMLFHALSPQDATLFMVGDIKQSIYRFRQASPDVFLQRRKQYLCHPESGSLILLTHNFRSRSEVTGCVNYMFGQIMTESFGGVDYKSGEQLLCAKEFPDNLDACAELHVLSHDENAQQALQTEANHVAFTIWQMLKNKAEITDNATLRPCQPGDFAILLRSGQQTAEVFAQCLRQYDIPVRLNQTRGYFQAREIALMISLLQVVDNPLLDVPLLAVLLSPMFGILPDDVAQIRKANRHQPLYLSLTGSQNPKIQAFLEFLTQMRQAAATLTVSQLIQKIYDETIFYTLFGAHESSDQKLANLRLLLTYAQKYETETNSGLGGFLRMIDQAKQNGGNLEMANIVAENVSAVQIMTIHKSKGLEFPIVFIARCGASFNEQDFKQPVVFSSAYGLAMKHSEPNKLTRYATLPFLASVCAEKRFRRAEELRVLYVAATRAKEKLIFVSSKNADLFAKSHQFDSANQLPESYNRQAQSFADWTYAALLRHPDIHELTPTIQFDSPEFFCPIKIKQIVFHEPDIPTHESHIAPNQQMLDQLKRQIDFQYPYEILTHIPTKLSVTQIAKESQVSRYDFKHPEFSDQLTPAQRGTAMHVFLQFADFSRAADHLEEEVTRLLTQEFITQKQAKALDFKALSCFFRSSLVQRIQKADRVEWEKSFFYELPAQELYPKAGNACILIQGIADCVIEEQGQITIIDYKTDQTDAEQLKQRYTNQLELYRRALQSLMKKPVYQCLLYSLHLQQPIVTYQKEPSSEG